MTTARHQKTPRNGRRVPVLLALILGLLGVLLVTLGACSSRPGPPQPSAAAAGVINPAPSPASVSSAAAASSVAAPTPVSPAAPAVAPAKPATPAASGTAQQTPKPSKAAPIVVPSFTDAAKGLILQTSQPVSLSIPSLGVKSALLDLGLNKDGTVQVPSLTDPDSKAGWYKNSPTPGAVGPAIILGHIDSKQFGPGVFYELGTLKPGQEIDVTRQDGTVAVFKVDGVRSYPKNMFPTKDVYGNIDHAGLRLITCGGTFDPGKHSYESNIVAYASLVSSHKA